MLPAADPPHRAVPGATAEQRFTMLSLAIGDEPACCWTIASWTVPAAFPVARPTVDTLRELRGELGPSRPLACWSAPTACWACRLARMGGLFGLAHFVVAERPGSPLQASVDGELGRALQGRWADNEQALFASPAGRILRLHHPLREESASAVRRRSPPVAPGGRCCRRPWPTMSPHTACTAPHAVNAAAAACPYNRPHVYRVDPL
jgi:nicotinate-nucleotide adenylyltransferase